MSSNFCFCLQAEVTFDPVAPPAIIKNAGVAGEFEVFMLACTENFGADRVQPARPALFVSLTCRLAFGACRDVFHNHGMHKGRQDDVSSTWRH